MNPPLNLIIYSHLQNLLLNKEALQVGQLPHAGSQQNNQLENSPPDHSSIGRLWLVSKSILSFLIS